MDDEYDRERERERGGDREYRDGTLDVDAMGVRLGVH